MTARIMAMLAMGAVASAAWAAADGAPDTAPSPAQGEALRPVDPSTAQLRTEMALQVQRLVEMFRSQRYQDRQDAQASLAEINKAYLDALLSHADDKDPEVRSRVLDMLADAIAESRIKRVMAKLSPAQREKLLAFRQAHSQIFKDTFSLNWSIRLRAVKQIAQLPDPNTQAEPLLLLALEHPSRELVVAAAEAAAKGQYRSDEMVDALLDVLGQTPQNGWYQGYYGGEQMPVHIAVLQALQAIRSPRAAPPLLALLTRGDDNSPRGAWRASLAEALAATGEKRLIPSLLEELKHSQPVNSWSNGSRTITFARSDVALLVMVRLTKQDPANYKFVLPALDDHMGNMFGFKDNKDRAEAIKQFKQWWEKNKDTEPYKDLKPLPLPDLADPQDE